VLDAKHVAQIQGYASTLSKSAAVTAERWEFWLVGSSTHPEIADTLNQRNRQPGHVMEAENYDVWVLSWGELIDRGLHRYELLRNDLDDAVTQEGALERVRARYGELIPSVTP
jgi:hypothetical protein